MNFELKDNTGVAFKNLTPKNEKSPAYKGTIKVNNIEYNLGLWIKTSKKGTKFLSITVSEKQYRPTSNEESFNQAKKEEAPMPNYTKTEDVKDDIDVMF